MSPDHGPDQNASSLTEIKVAGDQSVANVAALMLIQDVIRCPDDCKGGRCRLLSITVNELRQ